MIHALFCQAFATRNAVVFIFYLSHILRTPCGLILIPSSAVSLSATFCWPRCGYSTENCTTVCSIALSTQFLCPSSVGLKASAPPQWATLKDSRFSCFQTYIRRHSSRFPPGHAGFPASSLVTPDFAPLSTSILLIQDLSVSGVQPILAATDVMAAHRELCSCSLVSTKRTARSRTSGEYPGLLVKG